MQDSVVRKDASKGAEYGLIASTMGMNLVALLGIVLDRLAHAVLLPSEFL